MRRCGETVDLGLRIVGGILITTLGLTLGTYCVFFAPVYWHGWPIPAVTIVVLVTNPLLAWAAFRVTDLPGAGVAPAVAWCLPWLVATSVTAEGDALAASLNSIGMSWVGLTTFLLGPIASAVTIYRIVLRTSRSTTQTLAMSCPKR